MTNLAHRRIRVHDTDDDRECEHPDGEPPGQTGCNQDDEREQDEDRVGAVGAALTVTLDQIGETFGVTRERIRQIESKTMQKLQHPSRAQLLRDFMDVL